MPAPVIRFTSGTAFPSSVYLDTNLLLYARDVLSTKYRIASTCLAALIRQRSELNLSALVIDEFWWGLLRASHRALSGRELTAQEYKRDKSIWRETWPRIDEITTELLRWARVRLVTAASASDLTAEARTLMRTNPLAPRDAFHLAMALQNNLRAFVTADADFEGLELPAGREIAIIKF
ncbi:MAG: type II toxin-antitoxin system VapC family toxin [Candidatus Rokubacteria bacterium]|nr:type II toxin-antitoxin system VapC family toxin [Candidatus Rokubacteria bacterium]